MQATNKKAARLAAKAAKAEAAKAAQEAAAQETTVTLAEVVATIPEEVLGEQVLVDEVLPPVVPEAVCDAPPVVADVPCPFTMPAKVAPALPVGYLCNVDGVAVKAKKMQIEVCRVLRREGPLTRKQTAARGDKVDYAYCTSRVGSEDDATRKLNDGRYCLSLITAGLVRFEPIPGSSDKNYALTDAGKAFIDSIIAEERKVLEARTPKTVVSDGPVTVAPEAQS